jgi:3',5'-cyclic AMP phosphodiesterase CpdA
MRCLAQISDLHFGAEEPGLAEALLRDLREQSPSLIAISGDFTQRARRSQFKAARQFLECLPVPWIAVPGNHDIPLHDVFRRFLSPLARYREFISPEVDSFYDDGEWMLLGINTARSLTWKSGRISLRQIALIREKMKIDRPEGFKILMTHHPFIPPPGDSASGIDMVGRAALAVPVLGECRIDLLLAGHLHLGYSGNVGAHYPKANNAIISCQAGTAISHRRRDEPNAYNLLRLDRQSIEIEIRLWREDRFAPGQLVRYEPVNDEWRLAADRTVSP